MKDRCIVNYFTQSTGREEYARGTERLINCIMNKKVNANVITFCPHANETATFPYVNNSVTLINTQPITKAWGEFPSHEEIPYGFKCYAIQYAREQGYKEIAWMDSSAVILDDLEHLWKLASQTGIITFNNQGCTEATWTSDDCLEAMGCDFEYAKTFFQIEAFCTFFNFNVERGMMVFEDYSKHCRDGICLKGASLSNRPEFKAHRHDQSILSYLVQKHYAQPLPYGTWGLMYDHDKGKFHPSVAKIGVLHPMEIVEEYYNG